jgi:uncharacterized tellurite resistance protein B-like protein
METNELFLKTAFCFMACDGEIANEEIKLIKKLAANSDIFKGINVSELLNSYVEDINTKGVTFLSNFLFDLSKLDLSPEIELQIIKTAFQAIEADNNIEYSEISFFKKLRDKLKITDESILNEFPDKEDYLLPDIKVKEDIEYSSFSFSKIQFE